MSRLRVGSLFAGIGGFDLGFHRAGFDVAWAAEWDKHAQAVLRRRFPGTTVYGDIREIDLDKLKSVDVICGGFPCQDLSVAGKRAGLAGERSGLFHDAMRIVRRLRPSVLVLENVPGLLSSNHGLDFATVLREVGEGWDCAEVAWRVLDSQFFGVAQRRRRVFIVAVRDPGVGCAEEILALASSGGGHPPAKREARQGSASDAARCANVGRWWDGSDISASMTTRCHDQFMPDKGNFAAVVQGYRWQNQKDGLVADDVIGLRASTGSSGFHEMNHPVVAIGVDVYNGVQTGDVAATVTSATGIANASGPKAIAFHPTQDPISDTERTHALGCGSKQGCATVAVAFAQNQVGEIRTSETMSTIGTTGNAFARTTPKIISGMVVRRLTPVECERLQGFPDGWTDVGTPHRPTADSHRYKQLGNAVTVNVAEWLAHRVAAVLTGQQ